MKLNPLDVVAFMDSLTPYQMRHNEGVKKVLTAAGRAFTRLQSRNAPGPGRPAEVKCSKGEGGRKCRCAECRRANYPSYRHKPSAESEES